MSESPNPSLGNAPHSDASHYDSGHSDSGQSDAPPYDAVHDKVLRRDARGSDAMRRDAMLPDAILDEAERSARLFSLVNKLSDDQRRVIRMRFGEDKTIREIALELGRTEGAIKQLQFRAIENLRAQMGVKNA